MPRFSIRFIKILILGTSILFLALAYHAVPSKGLPAPFEQELEASLDSLSCDAAAYEALKSRRTPGNLAGVSLHFNNYSLFYDRPSKTYYYSLIPGSPSAANPKASVRGVGGRCAVAFLALPITGETILANTRHPFIVYDDTHYEEFFFSVTTLPILSLESNYPEYSPDNFITTKKSAVRMALFDNRETANHLQRLTVSEADVKTRGASSLRYPQKSYKLSLSYVSLGRNKRSNPRSLLDMRVNKDWIIYSSFNDPEKVRNIFSTNLWWAWGAKNNAFGIENGSQGRFVELFINGRYQGVYGLMQPIDGPQLKITRTDSLLTTDYYYRKVNNKPALEQDLLKRGHRYDSGGFRVRAPKNIKAAPEKWYPLIDFLKVLGASDAEFEAKFLDMIELDNAIDVWLFINTVMGVDNLTKNMGYVAKWDEERYRMLFSPWDLDVTWGMTWTGAPPLLTEVSVGTDHPLIFHPELPGTRVLRHNLGDSRARARKRYFDLRATIFSDAALEKRIDAYEKDIFGSGAYLRNRERWATAAFAEDMAAFRKNVMRRFAFMDKAIRDL